MADSTDAWYLRPAQAILLWSQGAEERLPAVAQQKCFSSGAFNPSTSLCSKLLGSVQKAHFLPGTKCKPNLIPGAEFTAPAELEMFFQMGQGRKPEQLSLLAMNNHPVILPAEHSTTPTCGAAEALQAKPEAGTEQVHRSQPPFPGGRDILCCTAMGPSLITSREATDHPSPAFI